MHVQPGVDATLRVVRTGTPRFVAGDEAFREAKDFMKMIMPSHAKNVVLYKDDQPLFSKYGIEAQLDSMFSPTVTLPSGGYIVINPTEALVSIDVNSVAWRLVNEGSARKAGPISKILPKPADCAICLNSWGDCAR